MSGIYSAIYQHNKIMYLGTIESPDRIIKDGLTSYLDAAQLRSYVRGGSTNVVSLFGGGQNCTLTNGVGFTTSYGGGFTFDGADDYINMGSITTNNYIQRYVGVSQCVWMSVQYALGGWGLVESGNNDANNTPFASYMVVGASCCPFILYLSFWSTYDGGARASASYNFNYSLGTPIYVVGTYDPNSTGTFRLYLNGALVASNSIGPYHWIFDPSGLVYTLGKKGGDTNYFPGTIYASHMYNRALTAAEVLNNYNASKTRFGL